MTQPVAFGFFREFSYGTPEGGSIHDWAGRIGTDRERVLQYLSGGELTAYAPTLGRDFFDPQKAIGGLAIRTDGVWTWTSDVEYYVREHGLGIPDAFLEHMKARDWCARRRTGAVIVRIDTRDIIDWPGFHAVFSRELGFPGFYGNNMDAWIDCLSYIGDGDSGMTNLVLAPGERVILEILDAEAFRQRCPEQYDALITCSAFVNARYAEDGEPPILSLSLVG